MGNGASQHMSVEQHTRLPYEDPNNGALVPTQWQDPRRAVGKTHSFMHAPEPDMEERPIYEWVLRRAAQTTRGIARVDLVRPRLPPVKSDGSIFRASDTDSGRVGYPALGSRGGTDAYSRMHRQDFGARSDAFAGPERGFFGLGPARGARIKLMRCIDLGQQPDIDSAKQQASVPPYYSRSYATPETEATQEASASGVVGKVAEAFKAEPAYRVWGSRPRKQPLVSFGIGATFEMDSTELQPAMRVRFQDWLTLKLMPVPLLKLQKSFPVPNTALSLRLRYECPLEAIEDFARPPARLMVRLDNHVGSGVHLSPSGVEFDQRVVTLGRDTSVRFGGRVLFPRQIPVPEGRPLLECDVERLGLKTSW